MAATLKELEGRLAAFGRLDLPNMDTASLKHNAKELANLRDALMAQLDTDGEAKRRRVLDLVEQVDHAAMLCEQFLSTGTLCFWFLVCLLTRERY